jgi:alkylation response protein AidB-like acyl-CoA dehydrogenase
MTFDLTPAQERCRDDARAFGREVVAPLAVDIDRGNACPPSILSEAGRRGLLSIANPQNGGDFAAVVLAVEAIAYHSAGAALLVATQNLAALALHLFGRRPQHDRWLEELGAGTTPAAILVWRAEGQSIRAEASGDGLRLTGDAGLVPGAARARVFIIAANASEPAPAASLGSVVSDDGRHIMRLPAPDPLGARGAGWADVRFENLDVSAEDRLEPQVGGADLATWIMNRGRLLMAAMSLGIGHASLDWAIDELRSGAVHDSQAVRFTLADVAVQLDASRVLTMKAATMAPEEGRDAGAAMAKLTATDAARLVTDRMLELTGARGFTREAVIERLWRDARAVDVLLGSTYAQRRTIGREILT